MKKIVAIFFLVLYGFTSIGATVHMHYCMDTYVGWNLFESKSKKCGKCGMKEDANKKGCCKDEHKEFKLKTDQQKSSLVYFTPNSFSAYILPTYKDYNIAIIQESTLWHSSYHPPPDIHNQNLQVLYCIFLI